MIANRLTAPVSPAAWPALFLSHPYFEVAIAAGGCRHVTTGVIRQACDCASSAGTMKLRIDSRTSLGLLHMPDEVEHYKG